MNPRQVVVSVNVAEAARQRPVPVRGHAGIDTNGLSPAGDDTGAGTTLIYAYPSEHYPHWQTLSAQAGVTAWNAVLPPGSLGEGLTLAGLIEATAWIGDLLRFPHCTLMVAEPYRPDAAFSDLMGFPQAASMMWQSGWCGFHLAVRDRGTIAPGDTFEIVAGPREFTVAERFAMARASRGRATSR